MKLKIVTIVMIIGSMVFSTAFAQDRNFDGSISVTGMLAEVNGSKAKFNEYRDTKSGGVYGDIRLGYDSGSYYTNLKASEMGYDTQNYQLEGGMWGKFKYNFFYNEIPHNITNDARSFYSSIGSANLTGDETTPFSAWNKFDYFTERQQYGGGLRFDLLRPFYVDVAFVREEKDGIKPTGINLAGPGGASLELPEPVDYITNILKAEIGYVKKPVFAALNFTLSNFDNDHDILSFDHPTANDTDRLSLPPDNESYRIGFKGALNLPMNSRLNANLSATKNRSDATLIRDYVFEGAVASVDYPNESRFNGTAYKQNYAVAFTTRPISLLDAKVFYNYYDKEDRSEKVTQTDSGSGLTVTNHPFSYTKNSTGIELGLRLPGNFYVTPAYKYVKVDRNRGDFPRTEDDIYSIDVRWTGLSFMAVNVGYERMERDGNWSSKIIDELVAVDPTDPTLAVDAQVEQFVRRYDAAKQDRDIYKAALEFYPMENLNFGVGFKFKKSDYEDTILGLREDERYEFNVDADYAVGRLMKLFAYFDFERTRLHQFQRRYDNNGNPNPFTGVQNTTNYNWDVTQVEKSYDYGVAADIYVVPRKLTLQLQYNSVDSDGHADFTYYVDPLLSAPVGLRTNENSDINNLDDYRKNYFIAKAIYNMTKSLSLSAGYAYERFRYDDAQVDGYLYTFSGSFLTGANNDLSYSANVAFASVAYKF